MKPNPVPSRNTSPRSHVVVLMMPDGIFLRQEMPNAVHENPPWTRSSHCLSGDWMCEESAQNRSTCSRPQRDQIRQCRTSNASRRSAAKSGCRPVLRFACLPSYTLCCDLFRPSNSAMLEFPPDAVLGGCPAFSFSVLRSDLSCFVLTVS